MSEGTFEYTHDSELGTKEYWDNAYCGELENYEHFGEVGDIWFGKKNLQRIVNWLLNKRIEKSLPILDIGCGNGITLISLAKVGFEDLSGIDYSDKAIELAQKIAQKDFAKIKFQALDFLNPEATLNNIPNNFHIIIDKGTYDAICLDHEHIEQKREQYIFQIEKLLNPDGYFIIISCNWTKDELLLHFESLKLHDEIEIPKIYFGGRTGQTVTALIFQKKKHDII